MYSELEPVGLTDGLDAGGEIRRGLKNDFEVFVLIINEMIIIIIQSYFNVRILCYFKVL